MNPKVSIIIPTYNAAPFLSEAINSVLNQTYTDFELIVVDDGSTDGTSEILNLYQHGNRVRCLFRTHTDRCTAKNIGIENARGYYIAFLDADDVWLPHKLEQQVVFLDRNPDIALVHGLVEMMDPSSSFLPEETSKLRKLYDQAQRRGEDYNGLSVGAVLFTSTLVVRKECLDQVGYFDPRAALREDLDLCLRIAKNGRIGFLGWDPVARYRYRGLEGHNDPAVLHAYLHVFQKQIALLESMNQILFYKKAYRNFLLQMADCYYALNELESARGLSLQAVRFDPLCLLRFSTIRNILMSFVSIRLLHFIRGAKSAFINGSLPKMGAARVKNVRYDDSFNPPF